MKNEYYVMFECPACEALVTVNDVIERNGKIGCSVCWGRVKMI